MSKFDPTKPLVMARFNTVGGFALAAGDPITIVEEPKNRGEVTAETAERLFGSTFVYADQARPTPVESPQDAARRLIEVDDLGGGWFLIRAPWLGEGEKHQGREATDARVAELIEAGQPADFDPATVAAANTTGGDSTGGQGSADDTSTQTFTLEETGSNGFYTISGPGLDEPIKVRGRANAEAKLAELQGAQGSSGAAGGGDATETGGDNTGGETEE